MKHLRVILILATLALVAFGVASAQDATDTPPTPEATAVPEPEADDASRPYLGIVFAAADGGVTVSDVVPGGPAELVGIEVGDLITAIDGQAVTEDNIREVVLGFEARDTVTVAVTRGEAEITFDVTLAEAPEAVEVGRGRMPRLETFRAARPRLGIGIEDGDDGVTVTEVAEGSPAEESGIQTGDLITAINGTDVTSAEETVEAVAAAVDAAEVGEFDVEVGLTRGDQVLEIIVTLDKPEMPELVMPDMPGMPDFGGRGFQFGFPGLNIVPREGEDGGFDVVVPFRPEDPALVTPEVTEALATLGITITPREGEAGVFDLSIPAESLGSGEFEMGNLEGMLPGGFRVFGLPGDFDFEFNVPRGRGFRFEIPDFEIPDVLVPAKPAVRGEGSL